MALGSGTIGAAGGAVSDLFAASALRSRAKGNRIEGEEYSLAANLADQNAKFTETSTNIKQFQLQRGINMTLGQQQADVAGSGFAAGGTALDLLADSARQGALTKAVAENQGIIEESNYKEQAQSFRLMTEAANLAATSADHAAQGAEYSAAIKGAAAVGTLFTPPGTPTPSEPVDVSY